MNAAKDRKVHPTQLKQLRPRANGPDEAQIHGGRPRLPPPRRPLAQQRHRKGVSDQEARRKLIGRAKTPHEKGPLQGPEKLAISASDLGQVPRPPRELRSGGRVSRYRRRVLGGIRSPESSDRILPPAFAAVVRDPLAMIHAGDPASPLPACSHRETPIQRPHGRCYAGNAQRRHASTGYNGVLSARHAITTTYRQSGVLCCRSDVLSSRQESAMPA